LEVLLNKERDELIKTVDAYIEKFQSSEVFNKYLSQEQKLKVQKPFLDIKENVKTVRIIDTLKNSINEIPSIYTKQNDLADELIYEAKIESGEIEVAKPKPTLSLSALQRKFSGRFLESESDVESYVNELKSELLKTIEDDKKISL
jgi:lysyl-tRNA synthetase class II